MHSPNRNGGKDARTKDFREALYGAILSSFENGRDATIGEADGRTTPTVGVKTSVLENGGATKGLL